MSFTIYPAIDMRNGKCVRLEQGDFSRETIYGDSPFDVARDFSEKGASWIHMVDLDGAKEGSRKNARDVIRAAGELDSRIQVGGGIRSMEDAAFYLDAGVDRVIIGSLAVKDPELTKELLRTYGSRIVIGLDAKDGYVATEGWLETSEIRAADIGRELQKSGAATFIYTDIARDGMLAGPNTEEIAALAKETGAEVIASGGIQGLADIRELKNHENISGTIIGKALYTGRFTLTEALKEEV
ncbi:MULTISPECIES: 1-(5-phosphoribosyl)-5-[(5-phosphoribosylamino)methylideneamino]imidazole-4-carboxamide isomerase [Salimicrobium]|uniref:1-(5-phosphoribosyl)-5-[(5-phosphoribosylamino)methylideneamino] imidazole-4-carboxamide isomerase n=1 Tax=Salimicrobium humidisoli TaxID=2029857 RepID=A0ABX4HSL7_9BACI|nr:MULTISPECIES: 1-(5-phosphoribosyl)-5-[(5-phosphoribosylamino)methylideneamino]imidazole-4-carboxamide isomerase [Salimicrobium]PBB06222.1 1-(5-phosphoribosyl)-5-[(5-phosphoribosylamino)methylideneamino]imidazole-4-carboxamide isomerase [Salimicrobium humidisoli]